MQHEVGDEGSHQVLALSGVQQGHIQNTDVDALFLGQKPPLLLYFLVIPPQTVDAEHIQ